MLVGRVALLLAVVGGTARADDMLPPVAATPEGATEPHWLTYAAFRNDAFTELIPPIDDVGFTHDNVFVLRRREGPITLGGGFVHRFITSRIDRRRWDLVELFAAGEYTWSRPFTRSDGAADPRSDTTTDVRSSDRTAGPPHALTIAARIGPTVGGNFGGRYLQNGWHAISKTGPTVEQGLANDYPDDRKLGVTVGTRARVSVGEEWQAYAHAGGEVSFGGTGVTALESALGLAAARRHFGAHAEVALTRYRVGDMNLALPGAYGEGFSVEWRLGVDVHWSRFRVGYEYRANEGGSGEPFALIEFSSTR